MTGLGRETINAASGISGIMKDVGLPIRTTPLAYIEPGMADGPIPRFIGSLPGKIGLSFKNGSAEDTVN
tara:strand:+ start:417 stop:623 length:207 start_codon:yes stop_codon:yes gene_type:complete